MKCTSCLLDFDAFVRAGFEYFASRPTVMTHLDLAEYAEGNPTGLSAALRLSVEAFLPDITVEEFSSHFPHTSWFEEDAEAVARVFHAAKEHNLIRFLGEPSDLARRFMERWKQEHGESGGALSKGLVGDWAQQGITEDVTEEDTGWRGTLGEIGSGAFNAIFGSPVYAQEGEAPAEGASNCPSDWEERMTADGLFCIYGATQNERFPSMLTPENVARYLVNRPTDDTNSTDLQPLFYDPAQVLNDLVITNMSDEALAALVLSQVYREENWDKGLNWIHPYYNRDDDPTQPNSIARSPRLLFLGILDSNNINDKRGLPGRLANEAFISEGLAVLVDDIRSRWEGSTLTTGVGFGLGNQTVNMALATAKWIENYVDNNTAFTLSNVGAFTSYYDRGLWKRWDSEHLMMEIGDAGRTALDEDFPWVLGQRSLFWNTARFVYAGARQREGLEDLEGRVNYTELDSGRPTQDISAFSIMGYVYGGEQAVATSNFIQTTTSDAVGERNKAIAAVEILDANHPENNRIVGVLGLQFEPLTTAYEAALREANYDPIKAREILSSGDLKAGEDYDFLPYSSEDSRLLISELAQDAIIDSNSGQVNILIQSQNPGQTWMYAPLLHEGFAFYYGQENLDAILDAVTRGDQQALNDALAALGG